MVNVVKGLFKVDLVDVERSSSAFITSFVRAVIAYMVECFSRNPHWLLFNILFILCSCHFIILRFLLPYPNIERISPILTRWFLQ